MRTKRSWSAKGAYPKWLNYGSSASSIARSEPQFALGNLSTVDFRWILQEFWEDDQIRCVAENWPVPALNVALSPFYTKGVTRPRTLFFMGRWLLTPKEQGVAAGVDVQIHYTSFTQALVFITPCLWMDGWRSLKAEEALALLISGVILMSKADFVRLVPLAPEVALDLESLHWGESTNVWSPLGADRDFLEDSEVSRFMATRVIDPEEWWKTEKGQSAKRTLSYLEKRIDLAERKVEQCRPPRRAFWERLGSFLRWS